MTDRGSAELSKARKKSDYLVRRAEGALLSEGVLSAEGSHLRPIEALASAEKLAAEVPLLGLAPRLSLVKEAAGGSARRDEYIERYGCAGVRLFAVEGGARIYLLPVETFPRHMNNVYLILEPGRSTLFDVGSGLGSSSSRKRTLRCFYAGRACRWRSGSGSSRSISRRATRLNRCRSIGRSGTAIASGAVTG
jgi:hypothetical protein